MRISLLFFVFIFVSIGGVSAQQFELYNGDTINYIDEFNKKQGYWMVSDPSETYVMEEGIYLDSKKQGLWKSYYPGGKIKQEFTFVNNRPDGYAKIYYENGKVSEEGIWKGDKWIGEYKYYYSNGQVAYEWNYNAKGKREGVQNYYYENGKIMISGTWDNGQKHGKLTEYHENGTLKSQATYYDGTLDQTSMVSYTATQQKAAPPAQKVVVTQTIQDSKVHIFDGNGYYEMSDRQGRIEYKGTFSQGRFIEGQRFFYDNTGNIENVGIYKNGKITELKSPSDL